MYMGAALCLFLLRAWKIAEVDEINNVMRTNEDAIMAELEASKELKQEARKVGWHTFMKNALRWKKV